MRKSGRSITPYVMPQQFRDVQRFKMTAQQGDLSLYPANKVIVKQYMDDCKRDKSFFMYYDHGQTTQADYLEIIDYAIALGLDIINHAQLYALLV
jgi:hypothetical protein